MWEKKLFAPILYMLFLSKTDSQSQTPTTNSFFCQKYNRYPWHYDYYILNMTRSVISSYTYSSGFLQGNELVSTVTVRTSEQVSPEYCLRRTATVSGDFPHISSISSTARCRWASSSWLKLNCPLVWSHLNLRFLFISVRIWKLSSEEGSVVAIELKVEYLSILLWSLYKLHILIVP